MTIQNKADEFLKCFSIRERPDKSPYYFLPFSNPENAEKEWDLSAHQLHDAIQSVHGGRMPNDFIYSTFYHLLEAISDFPILTIEKLEDNRNEIIDGLVDVYSANLTAWLAADIYNLNYIDEVLAEGLINDKTTGAQLLATAQFKAVEEVLNSVISLLTK